MRYNLELLVAGQLNIDSKWMRFCGSSYAREEDRVFYQHLRSKQQKLTEPPEGAHDHFACQDTDDTFWSSYYDLLLETAESLPAEEAAPLLAEAKQMDDEIANDGGASSSEGSYETGSDGLARPSDGELDDAFLHGCRLSLMPTINL